MSAMSAFKIALMRQHQWSVGRHLCVRSSSSGSNDGRSFQASMDDHGSAPDKYKSQDVQFSGDRSRDFMGQAFSAKEAEQEEANSKLDTAVESGASVNDKLESYDCHGSLNLKQSMMQSTVPEPFASKGSETSAHYNMPAGHMLQGQKYLSDDLQNAHYQHQSKREFATLAAASNRSRLLSSCLPDVGRRLFSDDAKDRTSTSAVQKESAKAKLKRAVKDYGSTVIVFHVSISLVSLGACYLAVSSGIDVSRLLERFVDMNGLAAGLGTFAIAYAVHKAFAPVRIGITLAAVPFIVRYLRSIGFLRSSTGKPPS